MAMTLLRSANRLETIEDIHVGEDGDVCEDYSDAKILSENYCLFLNYNFNHNNWRSIQIRRVDLDCLGVDEERERRRLQAAVRELGIQGATQVFKIIFCEINGTEDNYHGGNFGHLQYGR